MKCANVDFTNLSKDMLARGLRLRFQASGGSMHPFIRNGQIIQVVSAKISEINCGDIVFCRSLDNKLIIHRVIKKCIHNKRIAFLTKGDSLSRFDGYIYPENLLGKVIALETNNRVIRTDKGLFRLMNILCAKLSAFSKLIYFFPRKIRHTAHKVRNRYADRRPVGMVSRKAER